MNERSIKTLARCAALFALLLAAVSICAAQNAPVVLKVEPPNWWVGHSLNPVRVLIHGRNLAGARVEATGAGLQTGLTRINAAGTYLFIDVLIDGRAKPGRRTLRITTGNGMTDAPFEINAPLAPHPVNVGLTRVDREHGKKSCTRFEVREFFQGYTLVQCQPLTDRTHQVRVHLQHAGFPVIGATTYGGRELLLSALKSEYRLKPNRTERPLIRTAALHVERLEFIHPATSETMGIDAPWTKDLTVAIKYLRRYASGQQHCH